MSTANKYMQSASGAGGDALNVEDVFSTYLYIGNGSTQTITNGIDLDGEGGLVWIKSRSHSYPHNLYDTERGATKRLKSASTVAESTLSTGLTAFSSTGFTLGGDNDTNGTYSDAQYASWTFRKAKKFFDVVTYTGNGVAGRVIPHSLNSAVGTVIIKQTNASRDWAVWHRSGGTNPGGKLNSTAAFGYTWVSSTSTTSITLENEGIEINGNGQSYVAYLFAHNNNDGDFGPDADQDIIKCGVATISGDTTVDLGFEPQWVLYKNASGNSNWTIIDSVRGFTADGAISALYPNTSGAESAGSGYEKLTSTGFVLQNYTNGHNYVYVAIRRGTAVPESATEVFDIDLANPGSSTITTPFPVDLSLGAKRSGSASNFSTVDRLRGGKGLRTNATDAEQTVTVTLDSMDSFANAIFGSGDHLFYSWKRAPNYMDVVAFTGTGSAGTHNHNLTVPPEMMWVKSRAGNGNWFVYHSGLGATKYLFLNETSAAGTASSVWNDTAPTSSVFSVGASVNQASASIAYLFASLDGISKVGSYTGNGSTLNIDCGFTSGARFVLIRRVNGDEWMVFDAARGITSATNDPKLALNSTAAENQSSARDLDPLNSGFTVNGSDTGLNKSGDTYIFYAIA